MPLQHWFCTTQPKGAESRQAKGVQSPEAVLYGELEVLACSHALKDDDDDDGEGDAHSCGHPGRPEIPVAYYILLPKKIGNITHSSGNRLGSMMGPAGTPTCQILKAIILGGLEAQWVRSDQ